MAVILYALCLAILSMAAGPQPGHSASDMATMSPHEYKPAAITVVYDDHARRTDLRADHGFACLVEGYDQTILFDTGARGDILLANMRALQITPEDIDVVVLSHAHGDHTGGLADLLARRPGITVYHPASFSDAFVRSVQAAGANPVAVDAPMSICPGAMLTGPLGDSIPEMGLVVGVPSNGSGNGDRTRTMTDGALLITGCAHPGIVTMARAAAQSTGVTLAVVMGGFHLGGASPDQVDTIIEGLQQMGVERCGPAHCTGAHATGLIREAFGPGFIEMEVGAVVKF